MPSPKGKKVTLSTYVDAEHAHEQITRRSVTGILIFLNITPVKWYSKCQNTVESSTSGAELVALRIATEFVIEYASLQVTYARCTHGWTQPNSM